MVHPWGNPEGYPQWAVPAVRYRILDRATGEVVEHVTASMFDSNDQRSHLEFSFADQAFADEIRDKVQEACSYFYMKSEWVPLKGWPEARVSDAEIRERIRRLNLGENTREATRTGKRSYPIPDLPWAEQRALIEQIDRIKSEWKFEWIGEVKDDN